MSSFEDEDAVDENKEVDTNDQSDDCEGDSEPLERKHSACSNSQPGNIDDTIEIGDGNSEDVASSSSSGSDEVIVIDDEELDNGLPAPTPTITPRRAQKRRSRPKSQEIDISNHQQEDEALKSAKYRRRLKLMKAKGKRLERRVRELEKFNKYPIATLMN